MVIKNLSSIKKENNAQRKICPVCGASDALDGVPYVDNFVFCGCCFFHFGIDDNEKEPLMSARRQWFKEGLPFKENIGATKKKIWTLNMAIEQLHQLHLINTFLWPKHVREGNRTWIPFFDIDEVKTYWIKNSTKRQ